MTNIVSQSSTSTGLMYSKTKSDPAWVLWAETLAPYEAVLQKVMERGAPTSQDTFSQWWRDANPGGFSAKMFLHLMYWSSLPYWTCSDTIALLSQWTVPRLQVKAGAVSSWSDSIASKLQIDSRWYLSKKAAKGLIRRAAHRKKRLRVLIRDKKGAIALTRLTCMKNQKDYAISHTLSGSLFKDSLLDGLTEYLTRLANEPSAMPSPSPLPDGLEKEL